MASQIKEEHQASHAALYVGPSFPWYLNYTNRLGEGVAANKGRQGAPKVGGGWVEGSKVVRLWLGGGWPEVSRWSRGRCRGSNKLPPQTSFHVTTLTSLYGYRGQPCNLINCHERTTMLPETSRQLGRISWLSNFFARLSARFYNGENVRAAGNATKRDFSFGIFGERSLLFRGRKTLHGAEPHGIPLNPVRETHERNGELANVTFPFLCKSHDHKSAT